MDSIQVWKPLGWGYSSILSFLLGGIYPHLDDAGSQLMLRRGENMSENEAKLKKQSREAERKCVTFLGPGSNLT